MDENSVAAVSADALGVDIETLGGQKRIGLGKQALGVQVPSYCSRCLVEWL